MSAVGDDNFMRYVYRGGVSESIPREATHIIVAEDVTIIHERAFFRHPNIVEVICHDKVEKIGEEAFCECPSLRRVIMLGVKIIEDMAFFSCETLEDMECGKLEIIGRYAFGSCPSLRSVDLPSAKIIGDEAFGHCEALAYVKFGTMLERIDEKAFIRCYSLEQITIPLKNGIKSADDIFMECENLQKVDLIEGAVLQETVGALQLDVWRNDINEEIDSINRILPYAPAGGWVDFEGYDNGEKALTIRMWIRSVLQKIVHYKAEHGRILSEAATAIQQQYALPHDILTNKILPFLALPSHTFEGENKKKRKLGSQRKGS